ncbi:MAG: hypothetical protein L3J38_01820, partial [Thiomicrorhabdus sp.]|nr:hypothetical protein [Thiomicrorhabdus sp.]
MSRWMKVALFFSLMSVASLGFASYEEAVADYNKGNYFTAIDAFKKLAKAGDARSQRVLGLLYIDGKRMDHDAKKAFEWLTHASDR